MFGKFRLKRIGEAVSDVVDVAEAVFNADKHVIAVGTGKDKPENMLGENTKQTVTNKTISGYDNDIQGVPPVGAIMLFPRTNTTQKLLMNKWMRCSGQILSRSEYPELRNILGDDFRLPNLSYNESNEVAYFIKVKP